MKVFRYRDLTWGLPLILAFAACGSLDSPSPADSDSINTTWDYWQLGYNGMAGKHDRLWVPRGILIPWIEREQTNHQPCKQWS